MPRKKMREITTVLARLRRDYPVNETQMRRQKRLGLMQAVHRSAIGKSLRKKGHDTRNLYVVHVRSPETQGSGIHGRSIETLPQGRGGKQRTFVFKGAGVGQDLVRSEIKGPMAVDLWEKQLHKLYKSTKTRASPKAVRALAEENAKWDAKRGEIIVDPNVIATYFYRRNEKTPERRYVGAVREATIANAIEMSNLLRSEMKKLLSDPFVKKHWSGVKRIVPNVMEPIALFDLQQVPIKIRNKKAFLKKYSRYLTPEEKRAIETAKGAKWFKLVNGLAATSLKGRMRQPAYLSYSVPLNIRLEGIPNFKYSPAWVKVFDHYGINLVPESIKEGRVYSRVSKRYHKLVDVKKSILYSFADRLALALYTMDVRLEGSLSSKNIGVFSAHNITASATLLDMDTAGFHKTPKAAHSAVRTDFAGLEDVVNLFAHKLGFREKTVLGVFYTAAKVWQEYARRVGRKRVGK
jgi:hypothetical protein